MPSVYLQTNDFDSFGAPSATPALVTQASALIDGYLLRPEGLVWVPDANGTPCYMQSLAPKYTLKGSAPIAPGSAVAVIVTGPVSMLEIGTVLILDRGTPAVTESAVVSAIDGNTITLDEIQFDHVSGFTLDMGLTIFEQLAVPQNRPLVVLSRFPAERVLSGQGRYGYGRRGGVGLGIETDEFNLLATLQQFGGAPIWETFLPQSYGLVKTTGELWIPAGVMLAYYTEVRIHYIAGYSYASLPYVVKQACANLINIFLGSSGDMGGNIKSAKAGDTALTRFTASMIDADTKTLLNPFRVRSYA